MNTNSLSKLRNLESRTWEVIERLLKRQQRQLVKQATARTLKPKDSQQRGAAKQHSSPISAPITRSSPLGPPTSDLLGAQSTIRHPSSQLQAPSQSPSQQTTKPSIKAFTTSSSLLTDPSSKPPQTTYTQLPTNHVVAPVLQVQTTRCKTLAIQRSKKTISDPV